MKPSKKTDPEKAKGAVHALMEAFGVKLKVVECERGEEANNGEAENNVEA